MKSSTFNNSNSKFVLGIKIVMLLTIPLVAIQLQACNQKSVTLERLGPDYEGLLSGLTIRNAKVSSNGIQLVKEEVVVNTSFNQVQVEGTFVLKNPGSQQKLKMGIPMRIASTRPRKEDAERKLEIETRDIKVTVDGKPVKVKEEEISRVEEVAIVALGGSEEIKTKPQRILTPWQIWKLDIEKNQQVTIKVNYVEAYDKRAKLGRQDKQIDPIQVYYVSDNGKWEGTPERKITFKLNKISKDLLAHSNSKATSGSGDQITYKLPNDGSEKFVGIAFRENIKDKNIIKAIKAKIKTAKNKDMYVAKLVKEYDNRKMFKEKQDLYFNYLSKTKTQLSKQLLSLPAESIFHEVVNDLGEIKDKTKAKKLATDLVPILKKQIELNAKPVAITYKRAQKRRQKTLNDWLEVCQKTM